MSKRNPGSRARTMQSCELLNCHNVFLSLRNSHRFCSPDHQVEARKLAKPFKLRYGQCEDCGSLFTARSKTAPVGKRCGPCDTEARRIRSFEHKRRATAARPLSPCRQCGVNPARAKRAWYCTECRESQSTKQKCLSRTPDRARAYMLRSVYGIEPEDYDLILELQDGHCAFCPETAETQGKSLAVDHDHATGAIRGILCFHHNKILVDDLTPDMLRAMADYLEAEPYHAGRSRLQLAS